MSVFGQGRECNKAWIVRALFAAAVNLASRSAQFGGQASIGHGTNAVKRPWRKPCRPACRDRRLLTSVGNPPSEPDDLKQHGAHLMR